MTRNAGIRGWAFATIWVLSACSGADAEVAASKKSDKPVNLLLITIDTLRADRTSLYGFGVETTPGLEKLAADGALFSSAYAPVSATAPSHASIFTGNYPSTHRLLRNGRVLPSEARTLAEILSEQGYQTAAIASSFVLDKRFGLAQGFDNYQDDFDAETASFVEEAWEGHQVPSGFDRRADDATRRASRWLLGERDESRPFFLFVHYFDPHSPYDPPSNFKTRLSIPKAIRKTFHFKGPWYRRLISEYVAEIHFTDQEITQLLESLEATGLADNTLIIVTSDHGEGLMEHGYFLHGLRIYEEEVHVPLVMRLPGKILPGSLIESPVELMDLAPTILDLLEIDSEGERFDGRNLAPALRGSEPLDSEHPIIFYRKYYPPSSVSAGVDVSGELFGVLRGSMKLIDHSDQVADELYDLEVDPDEADNLSDTNPEAMAELRTVLTEWRRRYHPLDASTADVQPLSDADRQALEAMGYIQPEIDEN